MSGRRPGPRVLTSLMVLLGACGGEGPVRAALHVRVDAAEGVPLADARVWLDAVLLGASDASGALVADIEGAAGQLRRVEIACPAGHAQTPLSRRVRMPTEDAVAAAGPQTLRLQVRCSPLLHRVALVVTTEPRPVAHVPIVVDGEVLGQTGPEGVAHLLLQRPAGAELRVAVDTTAWPRLRPRTPVTVLRVPDRDSAAVVQQRLGVARAAPRRTRTAPGTRPQPPAERPYRIR